jgi:uncharacterized protein (TIGR01627 family)
MSYINFAQSLKKMKSEGKGLMSEHQYMNIGYIMTALTPCNILIFGLGEDSYLWNSLNNGGRTVFIEDNKEWISKFDNSGLEIINITYSTFVGDHEKINFNSEYLDLKLPDDIESIEWDMIIVDAPLGHGPPGRPYKGPGRMQSIFKAYQLLKDGGICVIDDMKRLVEQRYALHYFGQENLINVIEGKVAIFKKESKLSMSELIKGKSVAIVGPAKYMEDSKLGEEIDNHEVVVRINRGIESIENYGKDIGYRTDVYYTCLIERAQQTGVLNPQDLKFKHKIKHIVAPPDSNMQGLSNKTVFHSLVDLQKVKEIQKYIPVTIVDHNFHNDLAKKVNCKPNTGFMAIYDLLRMDPSSLSIYGFSFYLDGFLPGQKSGVEQEKNCSEQEFADMAFNSKRHIQKNMWEYAKNTLKDNNKVSLDKTLKKILDMEILDRKLFEGK